jgi:hypothetical protein
MFTQISSRYEHALAAVYHKISKRGILTDPFLLQSLREEIKNELFLLCNKLTSNWNISVSVGSIKTTDTRSFGRSININSSSGANCLLNTLKDLGYVVPATRKKDKETGEYEFAESADQLTLMKMFAVSGDENLKHVLRIRELAKILSTYVNAKLHRDTYYSAYNVSATVTGRRGSHKTVFGYGGNGQNFPKHSELGEQFLKCLIARPNKIFFMCDQMSAEEWPVAALSGNQNAIQELSSKIWPDNDRHTKLAAFVFNVNISDYSKSEWKNSATKAGIMRYLGGKKPRHANNYGMRGTRMSEILASEGFAFPPKQCDEILEKVHQFDPSVRNVFHVYIRNEINTRRMLRTPLGRERQFFGLRPNNPNYSLFNEAYAQIPQSTVGDNTGLSVLYLDENGSNDVIQESHDSLAQEVEDNIDSLERSLIQTKAAFNRIIRFDNGFDINIPIEGEIGYNFKDTVKLKDMTVESLREAYAQLKEQTCQNRLDCQITATV